VVIKPTNLAILKQHYVGSCVVCYVESDGEEVNMLEMLSTSALDIQQGQNDYEKPSNCCYAASS
jgi:hypothetical protein